MKSFYNTLLFLFFASTLVFSQERANAEKPIISKPIGIISKAKGWFYDNGNWIGKNNHIKSIDDFKTYSFHKIYYKGNIFLYLKKNRDNEGFKYPEIYSGGTRINMRDDYILDISEYKKALNTIGLEGTLEIPVIRYEGYQRDNFKVEVEPDTVMYDFGIKHYLGIKYKTYPDKKLARFLIYAKRNDTKALYDSICIEGLSEIIEFSNREKVLEAIQKDDIFTKFYYECPLDIFLKFIKSPLSL